MGSEVCEGLRLPLSGLGHRLRAARRPRGRWLLMEEAWLHSRNVRSKTRGAVAEDKEVFTYINSPYVWL